MKKTVMTAIVICIVGCGGEADAKTTTTEIQSTPAIIVVPNTQHIDYASYRKEWRRVNDKPAPRWAPDVTLTTRTHNNTNDDEVVELHLDNLSFKEAFSIEFRGKGEGHTFWWRGTEYTTNLLDVIRKPSLKQTDPYIERIVNPTTELKAKIKREDVDTTIPPTEGE